jgi:alkanesulfonate monooxygenase SsuD/methylene tetrahydromethanopterin reductase-like flavin-dependent oxidoreductase (luciferase family)
MSRVGFASGYDPTMGVREVADWMRKADEAQFEMGFFSETSEVMRDAPSALAAMALSTKNMTLGSAQVLHLRSPLVMAQTLATLDELSGGRTILGPGACTRIVQERHSLPRFNPAQGLIESVEAIRLLLTGENVSYHGEVVNFDDVKLGWKPIRSEIPMYFAATSRKGLEIAGRMGDGAVLNAVTSPEYSANAIRIMRESAEAAGRDFSKFVVTQLVNVSIEDDHQSAIDAIRWEVASKVNPRQIDRILKPKIDVGEPYMRLEDKPIFVEAWERGGKEALIKAVPDSYVEGMTASGTPDEARARVERYREAGVQLPILRAAAPHQVERLIELFSPAAVA